MKTCVYRLYSITDQLLYVGVSSTPRLRWRHHARSKTWWSEVSRKTEKWYDTREGALTEEASAIAEESPVYNEIRRAYNKPIPPAPLLSTVSCQTARDRLRDLADAAEQGQHTVITRHGRPVVALIPPEWHANMLAILNAKERAEPSSGTSSTPPSRT